MSIWELGSFIWTYKKRVLELIVFDLSITFYVAEILTAEHVIDKSKTPVLIAFIII